MGTPDFAVASLHAIREAGHRVVGVVTVPDRQTGRGLKVTYSPVKQYALDHQLPLLQPERLRDPQFLSDLQSWQADLNHHIDEGNILLQESTPITPDDDAGTLHDRLADIGSRLVVCTIQGLADGTLTPRPQPTADRLTPAPKIFKPDCAINWHMAGNKIVDFVRGLSPYPAATMQMLDHKGILQQIKVYQVEFHPDPASRIGELITDRKTYQKVGVKDGYIHILSLQLSGKKRINIDEFLRGYDVTSWNIVL